MGWHGEDETCAGLRASGFDVGLAKDFCASEQDLVTDEIRYSQMKAATAGLARPNSTEYIIREISALLNKTQPEYGGCRIKAKGIRV